MADDGNWYSEGFDDVDEEAKKQAEGFGLRRWYLPVDITNECTFVTDLPFVFREHNMQLDGNWRNWFTCLRKNCPICKAGNDASLVAAWIVVDHSEWTDKNGNEHRDELRLFVAKTRVAARIKKLRERQEGMVGVRLEIFRSEKMAPNTGDQLDVLKKYDERDLKKLSWWPKKGDKKLGQYLTPDWPKIFAPKGTEDLRNVVSAAREEEPDEDRPVRF